MYVSESVSVCIPLVPIFLICFFLTPALFHLTLKHIHSFHYHISPYSFCPNQHAHNILLLIFSMNSGWILIYFCFIGDLYFPFLQVFYFQSCFFHFSLTLSEWSIPYSGPLITLVCFTNSINEHFSV